MSIGIAEIFFPSLTDRHKRNTLPHTIHYWPPARNRTAVMPTSLHTYVPVHVRTRVAIAVPSIHARDSNSPFSCA